jgi:hypothetical protein
MYNIGVGDANRKSIADRARMMAQIRAAWRSGNNNILMGALSDTGNWLMKKYQREQDLTDKAKELLEACQYGYPDRLAYNTLLGISERETMASMWMEFDLLGLQDKMIYPLASSYTQSSDGEVGRPETPDEELTDSGQRTRDR